MAGLTKNDIKNLIKEALKETLGETTLIKDSVKEALLENTLIKDLISECIKTSVMTILNEVNTQDVRIVEERKPQREPQREQSMFQEKPLITAASKTKVAKKEITTNGDALREMFANEFGIAAPNMSAGFGQVPPQDMVDTLEDDPRVLRALGLM